MKKNTFFLGIISLFVLNVSVFAQKDSSGIYLTVDDFKSQKLSYAINYKTERHTINDLYLFDGSLVKVKHHGEVVLLNKDTVYGYKNTYGEIFRFANNTQYEVLNPGENILLYRRVVATSPIVNPTVKAEEFYYFSKDAGSEVFSLSIDNLKRVYIRDQKFIDAINKYFQKDEQLTSYDDKRNTYTLNRLLLFSKK